MNKQDKLNELKQAVLNSLNNKEIYLINGKYVIKEK